MRFPDGIDQGLSVDMNSRSELCIAARCKHPRDSSNAHPYPISNNRLLSIPNVFPAVSQHVIGQQYFTVAKHWI